MMVPILYYFNYSNESIIARSKFHGLTEQEGKQIASYIRTRGGPRPADPWSPTFQPAPGIDDRPAENWLGGGGLEAVLESEKEMLQYAFPNGTGPGAIAEAFDRRDMINMREIPINMQFPDWNAWLPRHAPEDIWGPRRYDKLQQRPL